MSQCIPVIEVNFKHRVVRRFFLAKRVQGDTVSHYRGKGGKYLEVFTPKAILVGRSWSRYSVEGNRDIIHRLGSIDIDSKAHRVSVPVRDGNLESETIDALVERTENKVDKNGFPYYTLVNVCYTKRNDRLQGTYRGIIKRS